MITRRGLIKWSIGGIASVGVTAVAPAVSAFLSPRSAYIATVVSQVGRTAEVADKNGTKETVELKDFGDHWQASPEDVVLVMAGGAYPLVDHRGDGLGTSDRHFQSASNQRPRLRA